MILYFIFYFTITSLILFFLTKISGHLNLVDYPDVRKIHKGNIPLVGGLGIYFSILISLIFFDYNYYINLIILTSFFLVLIGSIDDSVKLGVSIRLITQLFFSLMIIGSGLKIISLGYYDFFPQINLGMFSILLTVVAVMGLTNALNFIDGIDGLCASLSITAFISLGIIFYLEGYTFFYNIILVYIACLTSFLFFNLRIFNLPKIFLGDSGSMFLGFSISWFLIYFANNSSHNFHPVLALWIITLPTFDLVSVFIRRIVRGINPFKPDRRHIHYLMLDRGVPQSISLIFLLFISLFNNFTGIFIYYFFNASYALISFFLFFIVYFIITLVLSRNKMINTRND